MNLMSYDDYISSGFKIQQTEGKTQKACYKYLRKLLHSVIYVNISRNMDKCWQM